MKTIRQGKPGEWLAFPDGIFFSKMLTADF